MLGVRRGMQLLRRCINGRQAHFKNFHVNNNNTREMRFKRVDPLNWSHLKYCTSTTNPEEEECSELNMEEITEGDPTLEQKFKIIMLELDVLRQEGKQVPSESFMVTKYWKELLTKPTKSARSKFLTHLFKIEMKKENRAKKKEIKRQELEENPKPIRDNTDVLNYNLGGNHMFLRFYETTINQMYNNRLMQAMMFGQPMVVDCGFQENMTNRENRYCAKQLMLLFSDNRNHDDPYDLHFCNTIKDGVLMQELNKFIATLYEPEFPLNVHTENYLDKFPTEKLVYLTPHCRDVLEEYDHDAIYIIGAIVDKINNEPLSLAKAKKERIKMKKLPLDKYMEWGSGGGKSLTINQVISIMLDMKVTGDWNYALRHVPRRKLAEYRLNAAVNKFNKQVGVIGDYKEKGAWKPAKVNQFSVKPIFESRNKRHGIFDEE